MGNLTYGQLHVDFEDRLLAHLQIVIVSRFRRNEPLLLSWLDAMSEGDGRSSVWMTPAYPVVFKFFGSRAPTVNTDWLRILTESAASSMGLVVTDESGRLARAKARHMSD